MMGTAVASLLDMFGPALYPEQGDLEALLRQFGAIFTLGTGTAR